jgi:glycosyltransferase involved in cell wall biosynthesis
VVPDLLFGGLQRLATQLVNLTDPTRFDVEILVLGRLGDLAAQVEATRLFQAGSMSKLSLLYPRELSRLIRSRRPHVVHSHSGVWLKSARAARLAGVRWVIHTDHGRASPDPWQDKLVDHLASRLTDVVVAVSDPLAAQLRRSVVAFPDRVRVLVNGVDTDTLRPNPAIDVRAELGIGVGELAIGSIGRLEQIKGYDVMVDSFAELRRNHPALQVRLVIAGDGADRGTLEQRARSLGVSDRILFLGWRHDLSPLLNSFDIFTLTSRSEGTSVSLLEAMSVARCPVVTDVGGNRAVLGSTLEHRLVPSENPTAIAQGWAEALVDTARRQQDGRASRERVLHSFSLRSMVRGYESMYLEGPNRVPSSRASEPSTRAAI